MGSKRLRRLELKKYVVDRLARHNIQECKQVLNKTHLELLKITGTSKFCIDELLAATSKACCPNVTTAGEMWRAQKKTVNKGYLATSLPRLDQVLHGGLPTATISEIAGPSGCGKTQLCLLLSVLAVRKEGLGGAVLYIDTESAFSAERLVEIAQHRYPESFGSEEELVNLSRNVHVFTESTCASLLHRLENIEETLIEKKIKLLVIDSIASLVRKEFDSRMGKNMIQRTNLLAKQAAILKYIAETFQIPVVVTNQITTRFGNKGPAPLDEDHGRPDAHGEQDDSKTVSLEGDGGYVTAALGNTWSHSVNTRLIVQYLDGPRRQILVAKSPIAPFAMFVYTIEQEGIVLQEESGDCYEGTDPGLQKIRVRTALPIQAFL